MESSLPKITANYDHIELSDEELAKAIHEAKKAKDAKLKMQEYSQRLLQKPVYPKWDFETIKNYVIGNNPNYVIDEKNQEIFELLCMYFSNDPGFEMDGHSLDKGLMLFGPIGCGKTSLMKMFSVNTHKPFAVVSCRSIADKYSKYGSNALYEFASPSACYPQQNYGHELLGRCFDDLGTEDSKKNYGNEVNVMQDVIYKIYDNDGIGDFHITTNLSVDEIEQAYGSRIRSRLREMFNVITFDKSSPDRRK